MSILIYDDSEEKKMVEAKYSKVKNKVKVEVIENRINGGQEDRQRVGAMIRSIARIELGETSGKVSTADRREA